MTKAIEPVKEPKLTIKERKFLREYFKTGNGTRSAMKIYDCKDEASAAVMASQILRKLKGPMKTLMESKGLSLGDLIDTVKDARNAKIRRRNLETGEVYYDPDHRSRLEAVKIASKWLGVEESESDPNLKRRIVAEEFFDD